MQYHLKDIGAKLDPEFYRRPATEVAPDLVGKLFVRAVDGEVLSGWIVEVEAYMGSEDPASHAYRGETPRNRSMFGPPGHLYVYRSYGVHFCANVVTSPEGIATAVLLRGLEAQSGLELMRSRRQLDPTERLCNGPGNICQALGITLSDDGATLSGDDMCIVDAGRKPSVTATTRVGITIAADRPWRYVDSDRISFASRPVARVPRSRSAHPSR
ncbi:MAG TPA: DNA-3-methyladenine glycosylase [Chloroflexota bacterium]|nr:DNA-3-methyladenine glycosylase [Chloroflexota bacterium]